MVRDVPTDRLFCQRNVFNTIEAQKQAVSDAADAVPEQRLRTESLDFLAGEIAAQLQIEVPQLLEGEITVSRPCEVDIQLSFRQRFDFGFEADEDRTVKGAALTFSIPFIGDEGMFSVRPSTCTLDSLRAEVRGRILIHTVSGVALDQAAVKSEFDDFLRSVKEKLACQAKDVDSFNSSAKALAYGALQSRQTRLQKGDDLVRGLGYKIK